MDAVSVRGWADESEIQNDACSDATFALETPQGQEEVSLRNAMNKVMRQSCIKDCEIGVKRWNMQIQRAGHDFRWALTEPAFAPLHQAPGPMCRPIRWVSQSAAKRVRAPHVGLDSQRS